MYNTALQLENKQLQEVMHRPRILCFGPKQNRRLFTLVHERQLLDWALVHPDSKLHIREDQTISSICTMDHDAFCLLDLDPSLLRDVFQVSQRDEPSSAHTTRTSSPSLALMGGFPAIRSPKVLAGPYLTEFSSLNTKPWETDFH